MARVHELFCAQKGAIYKFTAVRNKNTEKGKLPRVSLFKLFNKNSILIAELVNTCGVNGIWFKTQ
jgi:hypothetical protein